jgi:hypothetical protein
MDQPTSPKSPTPAGAQSETHMTRSQVAARLKVSVSKVRTMGGKILHPTKVDGVYRFNPSEVDAVAKGAGKPAALPRTAGQVAAAVFKMFNDGRELRDIVVELEQPPAVVRALYREWFDDLSAGEDRRERAEREEREERERRATARRDEAETRAWERSFAKILEQGR